MKREISTKLLHLTHRLWLYEVFSLIPVLNVIIIAHGKFKTTRRKIIAVSLAVASSVILLGYTTDSDTYLKYKQGNTQGDEITTFRKLTITHAEIGNIRNLDTIKTVDINLFSIHQVGGLNKFRITKEINDNSKIVWFVLDGELIDFYTKSGDTIIYNSISDEEVLLDLQEGKSVFSRINKTDGTFIKIVFTD